MFFISDCCALYHFHFVVLYRSRSFLVRSLVCPLSYCLLSCSLFKDGLHTALTHIGDFGVGIGFTMEEAGKLQAILKYLCSPEKFQIRFIYSFHFFGMPFQKCSWERICVCEEEFLSVLILKIVQIFSRDGASLYGVFPYVGPSVPAARQSIRLSIWWRKKEKEKKLSISSHVVVL